jgi:hypothetical protein
VTPVAQRVTLATMPEDDAWYYWLTHGRVGHGAVWRADRSGPDGSTSSRAPAVAGARVAAADHAGREWRGDDLSGP